MKSSKACKKYQKMIMEALESDENITKYNMHLSECSECRNYYSDMQKYMKTMRNIQVETPYYIESKVMDGISGKVNAGFRFFPALSYGVTFAAIVLLAIFIIQKPLNNLNEKVAVVEKKPEIQKMAVANKTINIKKSVVSNQTIAKKEQVINREMVSKVISEKKELSVASENNSGADKIALSTQNNVRPAQQAYASNKPIANIAESNQEIKAMDSGKPSAGCPYGCLLENQKATVGNNVINPTQMQYAIIRVKVEETSLVKVIIYDKAMRPVSVLANQDETPGYYEFDWYGKNDSNSTVANDVYYAFIQIGNRVIKGYIVVKK